MTLSIFHASISHLEKFLYYLPVDSKDHYSRMENWVSLCWGILYSNKNGRPRPLYPCVDQSLDVGHPVFKHVFVSWCFDIWALAAPAGTVPPRASQSLERVSDPPVSSPFLCKPTSSEFTPQGPPSWGSPILGYYPPARITPGPVTTQLGPAPYTPEPAPTSQTSQP